MISLHLVHNNILHDKHHNVLDNGITGKVCWKTFAARLPLRGPMEFIVRRQRIVGVPNIAFRRRLYEERHIFREVFLNQEIVQDNTNIDEFKNKLKTSPFLRDLQGDTCKDRKPRLENPIDMLGYYA